MAEGCFGVAVDRVPYFSSSSISYLGKLTGNANADNARVLVETRLTVANFVNSDPNSEVVLPTAGPTATGSATGTVPVTQPGEKLAVIAAVAAAVVLAFDCSELGFAKEQQQHVVGSAIPKCW
eukprot:16757-Heterococcus_DN1.PRE.3